MIMEKGDKVLVSRYSLSGENKGLQAIYLCEVEGEDNPFIAKQIHGGDYKSYRYCKPIPKTPEEWFLEGLPPEYAELAISRIDEDGENYDSYPETSGDALQFSFDWTNTHEGHIWWAKVRLFAESKTNILPPIPKIPYSQTLVQIKELEKRVTELEKEININN